MRKIRRRCQKCNEPVVWICTPAGVNVKCELQPVDFVSAAGVYTRGWLPHWRLCGRPEVLLDDSVVSDEVLEEMISEPPDLTGRRLVPPAPLALDGKALAAGMR